MYPLKACVSILCVSLDCLAPGECPIDVGEMDSAIRDGRGKFWGRQVANIKVNELANIPFKFG